MTTIPLPHTLPAWIKELDAVVLPAFADVHAGVLNALHDSSLSMRQIAELIQESPVMALSVIRDANRHAASPAESLEVALSRIGLKRAEALFALIPPLDAQDISPALRQIILISRHASQQASGSSPLAWLASGRKFTGAACCSSRRSGHWSRPIRTCSTSGSSGCWSDASR